MEMKLTFANDNVPLGFDVPLGYNMPTWNNMPMGYNSAESIALEGTKGNSGENSGRNNVSEPLVLSAVSTPFSRILTSNVGNKPKKPEHKETGHIGTEHKKISGQISVYTLLMLWLLIATAIARFAGSNEGNLISGENLVMITIAFGLLSLWLALLARRHQARISHSIGIAGACVSVAGLAILF